MSYGPATPPGAVHIERASAADKLPPRRPEHEVCWINVNGLGDARTLQKIGERFGIHPLVLEDVANVAQRPKAEAYESYMYVVTRIPSVAVLPHDGQGASAAGDLQRQVADRALLTEQISICVGEGFVLTFQERAGDVFGPVRDRLRNGSGRLRSRGADYLAYALLDAALDSFFPLLEFYGERVEDLEQDVVERPLFGHIARIHGLKRDLLTARRAVWPQREMLNALMRDDCTVFRDETKVFLRDCYDHAAQLIDMIETYREIASGLVDIQLSSVSNKTNEVMKVLTIIATIFIPLTFIVGVYGMNFDTSSPWNLPELHWRYGYPAVLLVMAAIAAGLVFWFRHKGWIGNRDPDGR